MIDNNSLFLPRPPMTRDYMQQLIRENLKTRYGSGRNLIHGLCTDYSCFMGYSFAGWVWESVFCSLGKYHRLINRGFLNGPYCPIYGSGAMLASYLLNDIRNPLALFLSSGTLCCALEYATSAVMEKIFHARWWDYSDKPMNLNGRIYIGGFLAFGAGCTYMVDRTDPALRAVLSRISPLVLDLSSLLLFAGFVADNIVTILGFTGLDRKLDELAEAMEQQLETLQASPEAQEIYDTIADTLSRQQRRILHAFPRLESLHEDPRMVRLRHELRENRRRQRQNLKKARSRLGNGKKTIVTKTR